MNFQLLLQFPNNWTGSESKMMDSSTQYRKTLLEARLCRMASLDGESVLSLYWTDNPNSHEEVRAEILKLCQNYGIECIEHSSESTHVDLITQVFDKKPEWLHFMKLVAEDFLSPTDYALSCYKEVASVKDIDYSFSVNETPGTEFEILCCLTVSQGKTVSKDKLSQEALGRQFIPYDRSIDTLRYLNEGGINN